MKPQYSKIKVLIKKHIEVFSTIKNIIFVHSKKKELALGSYRTNGLARQQAGFTLSELVITMGIFFLLIGIAAFSISRADLQADLNGKLQVLQADIKLQQMKAMSGETGTIGTASDHGIYFGPNNYTLFRGSTYAVGNSTNFVIQFDNNLSFQNVQFQNSQIIFSKLSGEVQNYNSSLDQITILNGPTNESKTLEINKYGTVINEY